MNFTIAIPTYKRDAELLRCVKSISSQTLLPSTVYVIDDDALEQSTKEQIKSCLPNKVNFIYRKKNHTSERRGLSESRNISAKECKDDVLIMLDDDLILDKGFCEEIINVWGNNIQNKNLIGVGGVIINNRETILLEKLYNWLFCLSSKHSWDINNFGYQVWDDWIKNPTKGFYAHGGVFAYRVETILKNPFEVYTGGRTSLEDVELFKKLKNKGGFLINTPYAKVEHRHSPLGRERKFLTGFKESQNRKHIFKNHCAQSLLTKIGFCWASFGWTLRQFLTLQISKGLGMIYGFVKPRN